MIVVTVPIESVTETVLPACRPQGAQPAAIIGAVRLSQGPTTIRFPIAGSLQAVYVQTAHCGLGEPQNCALIDGAGVQEPESAAS